MQAVNDTNYKLQIWDTAGQERFRTITSSYYKNAKGILLTCDLSREDSLTSLTYWLDQVKANTNDTPIMIVGTKNDLPNISIDVVRQFANDRQIPFISTSSLKNNNVTEAFVRLIKEVIIRAPEELPFHVPKPLKPVANNLNDNAALEKKLRCC
jgi:small GTP-binding protein